MEIQGLARLRASIEPAGSYAVDRTGTINNFFDLRFIEAEPTPGLQRLRDERVVQRLWTRNLDQFGLKSHGFDFRGHLVSIGAELDAAGAAVQDSISKVFEAMAGGYSAFAGSLVASGASTTGVTVTAGQGGRFPAGQICAVETAVGSGLYEIVKIKQQAVDGLTFATALSFAPAVGAKLLGGHVLYPTDLAPSAAKHIQLLWEGHDRDDIWLLLGCQGSLGIEWQLGQLVMWTAQFRGSKWLHDDDIAGPQGGAALAAGTYDGGKPIPCKAGSVVLTPMASTARTLPHVDGIEFTTGITWQMVPSYNGPEGTAQQVLVRGEPSLVTYVPIEDESWHDVRDAQTKYQFLAQAGNTGAGTIGLECGCIQLVDVARQIRNGMRYWQLTWQVLEDENATDQTTDLRRAPWRIFRG